MCEFQKWVDNQLPFCEYTNSFCTLCVMGNATTYKEAIQNSKPELLALINSMKDNMKIIKEGK